MIAVAASSISSVAAGFRTVVKPEAAAVVATTFGFPIALSLAVLLFLVVQSRLDRRDPKLAAETGQTEETLLGFEEEDAL